MLSNSSKYAIKAVLYLAVNTNGERTMMVKDIATPINAPQAYTAKLLQMLSKEGVISSLRGPKGGFYLSDDDRKQPIINIINLTEGKKILNTCMLSLDKCNEEMPCPLHDLVALNRSKILKVFRKKSIHDLSEEIKSGNAFLPL